MSDNASAGINNFGQASTINNSTISGNRGAGIGNDGTLTLNNSIVSGNYVGILTYGTLIVNSSTVSGTASACC